MIQRCSAAMWLALACCAPLSPLALAQQSPKDSAADPALRDYLSANGLLNRGMFELAATEYRKFLAAHPAHEKANVARYGLGVALFKQKKYDEAAAELDHTAGVAQFEFAAESLFMLGQCRRELKQDEQAIKPLRDVLNNHAPHDLADDAAALLVESLYRVKQYQDVAEPAAKLVAQWPQSPQRERVEFIAGLALLSQKDDAGAAKAFGDVHQRFPQGEFVPRAMLLQAQCLHRTGDLDNAASAYQAAIDGGVAEFLPEALYGLGTVRVQQNQPAPAAELFDRFLKDHGEHALVGSTWLERGRLWLDQGDFVKATGAFSTAANADETLKPDAEYWLAKTELRNDNPAGAAARLKAAIAQHPQSPLIAEMHYDRAVALVRAKNNDEAVTALHEFISRFGTHAMAADALALHAMVLHEQKKFDESAAICARFLKDHAQHAQAPSITFLAAENDFLADRLPQAVRGYEAFAAAHANDPQIPTARFRLGSALYRQQKFDEARAWLEQVAKGRDTEQSFRPALLMVGDIHFQAGRWEEAAVALGDYASFGNDQPGADDAALKLGLALGRLNRPDDALAAFDRVVANFKESPHYTQAMFERGQVLLAREDLAQAEKAFDAVLNEGADVRFAPHAMNHLAALALRRHEHEKAADLFAQTAAASEGDMQAEATFQRGQALMLSRQFETAASALDELLKNHAKHERVPAASAQRAIALSRMGKQTEALAAIETVQRQHSAKLESPMQAALAYEKAWCLRELGRADEAAQAYRDLLSAHAQEPIIANALLELAEIEATAKHCEQAVELLERLRAAAKAKTIDVAPSVAEPALYRQAVCEFELGRFDQSATLAEEFLSAYPESALAPSARLFAGESLFKTNKPQRAATHFQEIIDKFDQDAACAPAMLRLGECQAALSRWADSEQTFAEYLKRFSDNELWFQAHFGLAWAKENQSDFDQAIEEYRKVIERHNGPTAARSQFQIGECLFAQKQFDDAVRELLKVDILYGYPEWSAAALYEAGRCFEQLAKPAEARAQFQQVREKYPDTQWAKLAAERLAAANSPAGGG